MKAAFIGANGYIGKHLAFYLQQQGWQVKGYGRKPQSLPALQEYVLLDVSDKAQYNQLDTAVDYIFYFAGLTGTFKAYDEYEKYIDVNEKGLLHLLDTIKARQSAARVIFPSTRLVYKGVKGLPLKEDAEKECKTIYALTKLFGEQLLQQYALYFNIPFTVFRICVPYGNLLSDAYSYGTTGFFLNKAKAGQPITLYGNGEQQRTFTHVADICSQVYNGIAHTSSVNQVFNIGGETFSLKEIADKVAHKFNVPVQMVPWPVIDEKMESGDTIFDDGLLRGLTNIPLQHSINEWLSNIV
jgi:UDP-glucose 4-epimerase